jgi:purine-binding chemotaxis protein CheW
VSTVGDQKPPAVNPPPVDEVDKVASTPSEEKAEDTMQVITFSLQNEEYALDIAELKEIVKTPEITALPNVPEFISGILNLRGQMVVVVDLEKKFNLPTTESKHEHVIITEVGENMFGILVNRVNEILKVKVSSIKPAPHVLASKIKTDYFKGVITWKQENSDEVAEQVLSQKVVSSAVKPTVPATTSELAQALKSKSAVSAESVEAEGDKSKTRLLILLDVNRILNADDLIKIEHQSPVSEAQKQPDEPKDQPVNELPPAQEE